jgi:hypothetical protein
LTFNPADDIIKKKKRQKEKEMGCFYTGFYYENKINGCLKIGESSKDTPSQRLAQIRRTESFECLGYLLLQDDTKSERLFIESYVRMKLDQTSAELTHIQNDHFTYTIKSKARKNAQAQAFADAAIKFAIDACNIANVNYKIGTRK